MWVMYFFLSYLFLALLIPIVWALGGAWRRAQDARAVTCPALEAESNILLDPWYAVRMHALGNPEARIQDCSRWPGRADCGRECLVQIGSAV